MTEPGALADFDILETGTVTAYAGKLFADHGAKVTLVEPPSGSPLRQHPPFLAGRTGPDRSLHFHYMSAGKHSLLADLDTEQGCQLFRDRLGRCDIILDDRPQSWWRELGLGFEALSAEHPRLVWCAVTPYGQSGPYADYAGTDLTAMAMGGMAWLAGYADGPTVSRGEIALRSAALYAAVTALVVALGRGPQAGGRFVDISIQEVVALGTETAPQFYDLHGVIRRRNADPQRQAGIGVYPCADGFVMVYAAEAGVGTGWTRLVEWMVESGIAAARPMLSAEWATNAFKQTAAAKREFAAAFQSFAGHRCKQDLFVEGQRRRIAIAPVNGPAEVLADPHLRETGYFRNLDIGTGSPVPCPGAPFLLSRTPGRSTGRAPALGEQG
ncbi:benzylsuccinate CoA-transferase BbsE subunit [Rhodoligotrophos appendicifer]|uniref:CaiB/BaiF CoA transferase family protein n=1 Tax=Rhodoligotrophos appendicifer TaxID=987056 RepID=UPI001185FBE9|nr:CoA transferase [Rhodoligotrophos appendicifer]